MNKIEELYSQKQYDLVVKLIGDSKDPKERFLALSSLVMLGKYHEALDQIEKYQSILEQKNQLGLMKTHFELLLQDQQFDAAKIALHHYENLPYVSQETEEFMRDMKTRIEEESHGKKVNPLLPLDELMEILESEKDDTKIAQVIFQLKNYNINNIIDSVRIFLKRSDVHANFRAYVLIVLLDQKYMEEVEILQDGKIVKVIPGKLRPPFLHQDFNEVCYEIVQKCQSDTSLSETALQLFNFYILDTYPTDIYTQGHEEIANAIVLIAKRYLKQDSGEENPLADSIQKLVESAKPFKV